MSSPLARLLPPEALARLSSLELVARTVVEGFIAGLHKSPFHGFSVEFAEYREYVPGDDLRRFDWRAYARSDRHYVKLFQEETNLKAWLLVDGSLSMSYSSNGVTKFRYAQCLAAALAYLMARQRDSVGLVLFDDEIRELVPARGGSGHLADLLGVLDRAQPRSTTRLAGSLHRLADAVKGRGLVVLVSDLLEDPAEVRRALRHFRHNRHELIVLHVFDPAELSFPFTGLSNFRDLETGAKLELHPQLYQEEYLREIRAFIDGYRRFASDGRFDYQVVDTSRPFDRYLASYLAHRMGDSYRS